MDPSGVPGVFDSLRAIRPGDVAVPAFLRAGDTTRRDLVRQSPDQGADLGHEVRRNRGCRAADVGVGVSDLASSQLVVELRHPLFHLV